MSDLLIHGLDTAWTSSNPVALQVAVDPSTVEGPFAASNLLVATAAAQNATATFQPLAPLDLSSFDELRFWIMADRTAEGTADAPFFLEFSYVDSGDAPGEEHRWFVSINMANHWEQRRIGIGNDRRSAVTSFRFRSVLANPFVCHLNELLAVFEQMLPDVEQVLITTLDTQVVLPGLSHLLLKQPAVSGANQIVLPLTSGIGANSRIRMDDGNGNGETHNTATVSSDAVAGSTTVTFAAGEVTGRAFAANVAFASVIVPVISEAPPAPAATVSPAIVLTMLDAREDLARSTAFTQRDSFRPRGLLTFASVRPGPRAYIHRLPGFRHRAGSCAADCHPELRLVVSLYGYRATHQWLRCPGADPAAHRFVESPPRHAGANVCPHRHTPGNRAAHRDALGDPHYGPVGAFGEWRSELIAS